MKKEREERRPRQVTELKIEGRAPEPEPLRPTPDVESDFVALLQDYGVGEKAPAVITRHAADTGSAKVFEDAMELLEKPSKFPL